VQKLLYGWRIMGKLQQKLPMMKLLLVHCTYYLNSFDSLANNITLNNYSHIICCTKAMFQEEGHFWEQECWSLQRPKRIHCWLQNSISYENDTLIHFVLHWRSMFMVLRRLIDQNIGNFRCTCIELNKGQQNGQLRIDRRDKCNWKMKYTR